VIPIGIKLVKVGISAGVGVLDLGTEYLDEKQGYTKSFQNVTDWARVAYTVGGYAANSMKLVDDDISEPMVLAGLPLLEKSVYGAVKEYVLKGKSQGRMGLRLKTPGTPQTPTGNIRWG